ncbi:hypothetical protein NSTC731_04172 [Nostoc sp. DSM 114167]
MRDQGREASHLFTAKPKPPECDEYVKEKVFSIDFDANHQKYVYSTCYQRCTTFNS